MYSVIFKKICGPKTKTTLTIYAKYLFSSPNLKKTNVSLKYLSRHFIENLSEQKKLPFKCKIFFLASEIAAQSQEQQN